MPYPNSPFKQIDSDLKADFNNLSNSRESENLLENLLKWICTAPKCTSIRFHDQIMNCEEFKIILKNNIFKKQPPEDLPKIYQHPVLRDVVIIESPKLMNRPINLDKNPEVIVDCSVGAAILRGAHIFAPGIKGLTSNSKIGGIVNVYVDMENQCKKGLAKQFQSTGKVFVGQGVLIQQRHQVFTNEIKPRGIAVEMKSNIANCPSLDDRSLHAFGGLLQNLPSIVCGHVVDPKPSDLILDMCAAPGNKTTHLASLMQNQGKIIALEKVKSKINPLIERCKLFKNVQVFQFDSTKVVTNEINCLTSPPFSKEMFDKILLDAPCSGLGQRPQFCNNISTKELKSYVPLQRKLFTNAVELLKPGGFLIYSTCTFTLAENEMMVAWALRTFSNIGLVAAEPKLGGSGWKVDGLTDEQCGYLQRFSHLDCFENTYSDSVGFFIAKFVKNKLI